MSEFEKVPREVRDLIYEHCLLYDGEIVPFPSGYETSEIERWPQVSISTGSASQRPPVGEGGRPAFLGHPFVSKEAFQTEHNPCLALLGVNSKIRDEAASILFGKNVWRLLARSWAQGDNNRNNRLWQTYARYFRHIVTMFDAHDYDAVELLDLTMKNEKCIDQESDHFDQAGIANVHKEQLSWLKDDYVARRDTLQQMNLKSLSFDFSNLFCFSGCCRREAIQNCLVCLGPTGPWSMLERERSHDSETKEKTDVKVFGLKDDDEKRLFWETWGLKVD